VPSIALVRDVPASIDLYWSWVDPAVKAAPANLANGKGLCTWLGPYNWTIQSYLYLRAAGVPCALTPTWPEAGIIIAHGDFLPPEAHASRDQFIVEIKPDRRVQCLYANFVVVQNAHDPIRNRLGRRFVPSGVVDYWPQAGLIPRDPARADRFENVCYMGNPEQFLAEVDEVEAAMVDAGVTWRMVPREQWHDYRAADAIVAVRPLGSIASKAPDVVSFFTPNRKPAAKLLNAWRAGVPAVLSPDVAYRDLRRSELDFLEATTVDDIACAVRRLRDDPALRQAMVENGRSRAAEFSTERIVSRWRMMVEHEIVPAFERWRRSNWRRQVHGPLRRLFKRLAPDV
jgi:hypothetical protein